MPFVKIRFSKNGHFSGGEVEIMIALTYESRSTALKNVTIQKIDRKNLEKKNL